MKDLKTNILSLFSQDQYASLATVTPQGYPWVRYVTLIAKTDFPLVFCTSLKSRKIQHIKNNSKVHLICGTLGPPDNSVYLQIQAKAAVRSDPRTKAQYWKQEWIRHFKGPDDPDYVIVEIDPFRIEYYGLESFQPQIWEKK